MVSVRVTKVASNSSTCPCAQALLQGDRVVGDKDVFRAESEIQGRFQGGAIQKLQLEAVVDAQAAVQENPFRCFATLDDAAAVVLGGDEVQAGHLGDGMADGLV